MKMNWATGSPAPHASYCSAFPKSLLLGSRCEADNFHRTADVLCIPRVRSLDAIEGNVFEKPIQPPTSNQRLDSGLNPWKTQANKTYSVSPNRQAYDKTHAANDTKLIIYYLHHLNE